MLVRFLPFIHKRRPSFKVPVCGPREGALRIPLLCIGGWEDMLD